MELISLPVAVFIALVSMAIGYKLAKTLDTDK